MSLIIKARNIRLDYAGRDVLDIDELEIHSYDRIGLVGDNGAGKSSLLKVLNGEIVLAEVTLQRFGDFAHISQLGGIEIETVEDRAMLSRLGVSNVQNDTMSGGEETRAKIAAAFSQQVHGILADEPTSHLDLNGIDLLIGQLKAFDGALLVISHDRYFLDMVVDKIWELKDGKITEYWGGYSDYLRQKEEERQHQAVEYELMMKERERLESAVQEKRQQANRLDNKKKGEKSKNSTESAGRLGHAKMTGTKQRKLYQAAKSMEKRLAALEDIQAPEHLRSIRFRQSSALELHNKFPITADGLSLKFGSRTIFDDANFIIPLGAKVAITGSNGTGKTSLLKMISERADGLTISPKAEIGYFTQTGYKFNTHKSVLSFMQEECEYTVAEIRAVLASMGIGANDIQKNLSDLSGGEIIKLLLSKMLLGKYNILLMDEPGNYLDLKSIAALETMMKSYAGTIIFVSHDKQLVDNIADIIYEIKDHKIIKTFERDC